MSSTQKPPELIPQLRKNIVRVPEIIDERVSGITINGKTIRSIIFSTDIAIIRNTNANAVIAVYPFTPHPAITQAIMSVADIPVLCGVGGGTTNGIRSVNIALHAEFQGALGVVLNAPTPEETVRAVKDTIDIPVVLTVVSEFTDIEAKLRAGADIINVSGARNTASIVRRIREAYPELPIIATGGDSDDDIARTIEAGANAISYTPPTNGELFKTMMNIYRKREEELNGNK